MDRLIYTYYHEMGLNIIPLTSNEKIPVKGFDLKKSFKQRLTEAEFEVGFSIRRNVGLVTGTTSGVAVIDIDDGSLVNKYIETFPDVPRVSTRRGVHLYFKALPSNRQGVIEPGVEYFSGNHYVLVPPSVVSDFYYRWSVPYKELTPFPDHLITSVDNMVEHQSKYSLEEIDELEQFTIEHGHFPPNFHNDGIFYLSLKMAKQGIDQEIVLARMLELDKNDPTPQSPRIVTSLVERVFEKYTPEPFIIDLKDWVENPVIVAPEFTKGETVEEIAKVVKPLEFVKKPLPKVVPKTLLTQDQLSAKYENFKVDWLIKDWFQVSGIMMLYAPPQNYKTWLALDMAVAVATGRDYLGHFKVENPGNVLVLQQEDFMPMVSQRADLIQYSMYARNSPISIDEEENITIEGSHITYFETEPSLRLDSDESLRQLTATIVNNNIKLCIIDPVYSLGDTSDYLTQVAESIRKNIKYIRRETGCGFLFVHHSKKGEGTQSAWGSQFFTAAMEGRIEVSKNEDCANNQIIVGRFFKSAQTLDPIMITFNIDTETEELTAEERYSVEVGEQTNLKEDLVRDYLIQHGETKIGDLYEALKSAFTSKAKLTKLLETMTDVTKTKVGYYEI